MFPPPVKQDFYDTYYAETVPVKLSYIKQWLISFIRAAPERGVNIIDASERVPASAAS
jgi:hypothetical protein